MKTRLIIAILLMTCTAAWAQKDVAAIKKAEGKGHVSGKRWAIVMGVNKYDDARVRDLEFAANDARLMAAALEQSGLYDGVYLFADGEPNAEPTFDNVLMKLSVVTKNAGPNDMILFFFSGHGFPDDQEGHNYLVAKNTNVDLLLKTGIGLQEIYRFLNDSKARSKVVLLDACHSGPRKDKAGDLALSGQYLYNGVGSVAIASSQYEQSSWEWPEKGTGAFTWFLVQGMGGEADVAPFGNGDGLVTSHELNLYVTEAVQSWANQNNRVQTPRADINMTGDVVLGIVGGAVTPPPPAENMRANKQCVGNDLYWYGDRGSRGELIGACTANSTCSGGQCICESGYDAKNGVCVKSVPRGIVYIPAGSFTMGCSRLFVCNDNERPVKKVTISKGFYMDATEVTQGEYERVMGKTPSAFKDCGSDCPVEHVSWYDAKSYCKKVGKRLPTEAEWEYAARAGTTTMYYWGDSMDESFTWYTGNSDRKTHPVGLKRTNNYALYDMSGNVSEWVADCYEEQWYSKMPDTNPVNVCTGGGLRVVRGGSFLSNDMDASVYDRDRHNPSRKNLNVGFRCVMDIE